MPLTRIEIEELGPGRWVGHVEGGGTTARRREFRATSFDDAIERTIDVRAELYAPPAPKPNSEATPPVVTSAQDAEEALVFLSRGPSRDREAAESNAIAAEVAAMPALNALRDRAEGLGIDVDGRWGAQRLRDEIEKVRQREGNDPT